MADQIEFQAVTWESGDEVIGSDNDGPFEERRFFIHAYGRDAKGQSVHLRITDFSPFLYLKVCNRVTSADCVETIPEYLKSKIKQKVTVKVVRMGDMWGFQNGKKHYFVQVSFQRVASMQRMHRAFESWTDLPPCLQGSRLYESNIEPLLRFFHMRQLASAGWIRISTDAASECSQGGGCDVDWEVDWKDVHSCSDQQQSARAPLIIASFDIECHSRSGNFPVAARDHFSTVEQFVADSKDCALAELIDKVQPPAEVRSKLVNSVKGILKNKYGLSAVNSIATELAKMGPDGDPIVQIGVTAHTYGETTVHSRTIFTSGACFALPEESLPADDPERINVVRVKSEKDLLVKFVGHLGAMDPDLITGYNIFGFDWKYIVQRAMKLGIYDDLMDPSSGLSRDPDRHCTFVRKVLTSSAMGDNVMYYVEIPGRTTFDLMKIVQRDHKLDSYKLDNVGKVFLDESKHDVSPAEIFAAWNAETTATAKERARVARYCVQDCALCNRLVCRLDIVPNTLAMATVCYVPMRYIFFRGQGVKIFSLVLQRCAENNMLFPTIRVDSENDGKIDGDCTYHELSTVAMREGKLVPAMSSVYDGATVLTPVPGVYVEPVAVLDYASLYPSSMISENISHDTLVMEEAYANLAGVDYIDIDYIEDGHKVTCRYAANPEGILPQILRYLLGARKATRAKAKWVRATHAQTGEVRTGPKDSVLAAQDDRDAWTIVDAFDAFEKKVLDGMQLAYKLTANSLYGQMGAVTSPVYLKPLAACTTATGRRLIMAASEFMVSNGARCLYGDTDSIFAVFPRPVTEGGVTLTKQQILQHSIDAAVAASKEFRKQLKPPHDLEYEKHFYPFIIFSKKRYVGLKYEFDVNATPSQSSMGIALKRRDNAPIVKHIYGGALDIILNASDIKAIDDAIAFVRQQVRDVLAGSFPIEQFIVSKTLRMDYKAPDTIAHKMLADRVARREPGNAFQSNDRVPYVHIVPPKTKKALLMGQKIETPDYVNANGCTIDYAYYITNQVSKPVCQLFALVADRLQTHARVHIDYESEQERLYRSKLAEVGMNRADEARDFALDRVMIQKEKLAHDVLLTPPLRDHTLKSTGQRPITGFLM